MSDTTQATEQLLQRVAGGDGSAVAELFAMYREKLLRMVRLRLDRRARGRVSTADIVDQIFADAAGQLDDFLARRPMSFYAWLRFLAGQRLVETHRTLLDNTDSGLDVSLYRRAMPVATTVSVAAQFLGSMTQSFQAAARADSQVRLQEALNSMEAIDREVLVLRHFEEMNGEEIAEMLDITPAAAMTRYLRALKKLGQIANFTSHASKPPGRPGGAPGPGRG